MVAFVCGPVVTEVITASTDSPVAVILEVAVWIGWFVGLVATLVPHPISLTVLRILAPTVAGVGLLIGLTDRWTTSLGVAIAYGLFTSAVTFLPAVGDQMVNGSAYGSERRMALRAPAAALVGPVPVAWLVAFAGLVTWAWLAAAGQWLLAIAAALIGAPLILAAGRVLHQLSRRWIVFVPAGFVLHDLFHLTEPVLLARSTISSLGPAPAEGVPDRLDFSGGALGLALEVETKDTITFSRRRGRDAELVGSRNIVFSPTLPGALLSEARGRGIKIGEPGHVAG
jgi:hypothetical protein